MLLLLALPVFYIGLCLLVGWLGRKRKVGFVGFFLISLLLTPVPTVLILLVSGPGRSPA
jgi:Sec-independent protein secretion pathway component TatC